MNIEDIKHNYEHYEDAVIIKIARHESDSLPETIKQILKAEILKRNLSSDLIDIIDKKTEYTSKGKFENILLNNKVYYANNFFRVFSIISIVLICFFAFIKPFVGFALLKLIFWGVILFFVIKLFFPKQIGKIIHIKKDTITLSLYPSLNFHVLRIVGILKVIFNQLDTVEVQYNQIIKIYKNTNFLDGGGYYIKYNDLKTNKIIDERLYSDVLTKNDFNEFIQFLKYKNVKVEM